MLNHWSAPLRTSVPILADAAAKLLQGGDLPFIAFVRGLEALTFLAMGQPLARVRAHIEAATKQHPTDTGLLVCRQAVRCLQGATHGATRFDDGQCDQQTLDAAVATSPTYAGVYEILRLQLAYVFRDFQLAQGMSDASAARLPFLSGFFAVAEHNFYSSLTSAARADLTKAEAPALLARIGQNQQQLDAWAERCPDNFRHKHALVAAEVARLEGRPSDAIDLYDRAVEGAARGGFTQDEALAHELAGRMRLALGRSAAALPHLVAAEGAYLRWGVTAKARALIEEHPALADGRSWSGVTLNSEEGTTQALDLLSVIKASEAISRELAPDQLLDRLMTVCLEAGGAQRGALVLEEEDGPVLRAMAELGQPVELTARPFEASGLVPVSVIEEARRSATALVLSDAALHPRFAEDPYIAERYVRSVLAVPIVRQATAMGVLYLENNMATRAFTPERVRVLSLLSSQIAVSLAHSRLFASFTHEIEERRRAEAALRFLVEAGAGLSESLDYRVILDKVAHAAVPFLADGCVVDMIMGNGQRIARTAVAHVDPTKEAALHELHDALPRWESDDPIAQRLRSGEAIILPEVNDRTLAAQRVAPEFIPRIRALGARTLMSLPLTTHARTLGVMHLGSAVVGRRYGAADLQLARELAYRCAMAIENAYLYHEAQEAIAVRDEFLSIASHELRTPLTALQLGVQGFVRRLPPADGEAAKRQLALIDRQTQRLTRLVEMLLEVSRIHADRFELEFEFEELDMGALIEEAAEHHSSELARAGCDLSLSLQPSVVGYWDRLRLEEVLTNLLSNAIKFGAGGPIAIELEAAGDRVRLSVRDQGIGIPSERQPHIFERFERAVSARAYGGLGLGLYITRRIVQAMGGTIGVESRAGAGSTFTVELPRDCRRAAFGAATTAASARAT
jgi:signal transduction histidine kinase